MRFYRKRPCRIRPRWTVSLVSPFFRVFSSADRRRAHIQFSAAYSLISGWDTEVKQYNSCLLLRPLPRDRGCTEEGIIVDLLYLASPISIRHPFRSFSPPRSSPFFFLSNSLLVRRYVPPQRCDSFYHRLTQYGLYLFPFRLLSLSLSLSFFRWFFQFLGLRLCGIIRVNNATLPLKSVYINFLTLTRTLNLKQSKHSLFSTV